MIRKLPPHLIHQIAAGEVIERPSSVLKELIENALDAGASKIQIRAKEGGLKELCVEDDGSGMTDADLSLAFESHATSKLSQMDDFRKLASFGFRGEALASVGSVADVVIETSSLISTTGLRLRNSFGRLGEIEKIDKRMGTKIRVNHLFDRLPARLKFMKSVRAEALALQQMLRRYAVTHPKVSWTYTNEDSDRVLQFSPTTFFNRGLEVLEARDASQWFLVDESQGTWKVEILALHPKHRGSVSRGFYLYLNDRPLKDVKMEMATRRGFEGFTEFPREITAIVRISGDPEDYDVNVHPMKLEVRFQNPDEVFSLIVRAIRKTLDVAHYPEVKSSDTESVEAPRLSSSPSVYTSAAPSAVPLGVPRSAFFPGATSVQEAPSLSLGNSPMFSRASSFEYLMSLDQTFLVCRRNEDLYLFDQHALHERILYERLLLNFEKGERIASQRLLFPIPLLFQNAGALIDREAEFLKLGFEIRVWNDQKAQLVSAPAFLKREPQKAIEALIESWEKGVEAISRQSLATLACHSAVRAHDVLARQEIDRLLLDFESEDSLGHCPHGRPTFVRLQIRDLEKMFHRIL